MQIKLMRRTSSGLQGTYRNADHHAKALISMIRTLEAGLPSTGTALWEQGHNTHVLVSTDGRRLVFRPLAQRKNGYIGLTIGLKISRSQEIHLATIYADDHKNRGEFPLGQKLEHTLDFIRAFMEQEPRHESLSNEDLEPLAATSDLEIRL